LFDDDPEVAADDGVAGFVESDRNLPLLDDFAVDMWPGP